MAPGDTVTFNFRAKDDTLLNRATFYVNGEYMSPAVGLKNKNQKKFPSNGEWLDFIWSFTVPSKGKVQTQNVQLIVIDMFGRSVIMDR